MIRTFLGVIRLILKSLLGFVIKQFVLLEPRLKKLYYNRKNQILRKKLKSCGQGCYFHDSIVVVYPERLSIGNNVHLTDGAFIHARGGVTIGDNVHISRNVTICSYSHNYDGSALPYDSTDIEKPVVIGKNVWVGMNVEIIPGVTIGDGAIIGLGTVVSKDVPPLAIVGGQAQRVIKYRDEAHYKALEKLKSYGGVGGRQLTPGNYVQEFFSESAGSMTEVRSKIPALVQKYSPSSLGRKILDVGCGHGSLMKAILDENDFGVGLDITMNCINISKSNLRERPFCGVQGSGTDLSFRNSVFDWAICTEALMVFPSWREGLEEFGRVIKPGGKIAISIPYYNNLLFFQKKLIDWFLSTALMKRCLRLNGKMGWQPINFPPWAPYQHMISKKALKAFLADSDLRIVHWSTGSLSVVFQNHFPLEFIYYLLQIITIGFFRKFLDFLMNSVLSKFPVLRNSGFKAYFVLQKQGSD